MPTPPIPEGRHSNRGAAWAFVKALVIRCAVHEVRGRSAHIAFYFFLAAVPTVLALLGVLSFFDLQDQQEVIRSWSLKGLPPLVGEVLLKETEVLERRTGWPLLFSVAVTVFYCARGIGAVLRGIEVAFEQPTHAIKTRLASFGVSGLGLVGLVMAIMVLVALSWVGLWAEELGMAADTRQVLRLTRWPILVVVYQQYVNMTYQVAGRHVLPRRLASHGSVMATAWWILVTQLFESYVSAVTDLGATYGSLGSVAGLLLYSQLVCTGHLVGAEIEAMVEERRRALDGRPSLAECAAARQPAAAE